MYYLIFINISSNNDIIVLPQIPSARSNNLTIPPFNVTHPQLWFIRLEDYFVADRVYLQRDKFGHGSSLPPDKVTDIV